MLVVDQLARPGLGPVSLRLAAGECVVLRGKSGSGKTLLLRAIADLDPCTGRVCLDGVERSTMPAFIWRRRVGYLAAEPGWWADKAGEHFQSWPPALPMVQALLLPGDIAEKRVIHLSTGERQRLALVRALMQGPNVLLLDEPTAALDGASRDAVEGVLKARLADGMALLWVTHDPEQARRVASRVLEIEDGRLKP